MLDAMQFISIKQSAECKIQFTQLFDDGYKLVRLVIQKVVTKTKCNKFTNGKTMKEM